LLNWLVQDGSFCAEFLCQESDRRSENGEGTRLNTR
jgi:hypothetical protein